MPKLGFTTKIENVTPNSKNNMQNCQTVTVNKNWDSRVSSKFQI